MERMGPKQLSAQELKTFFIQNHEQTYLLVDVRLPGEYTAGHIPGAQLLPLSELEAKIFDLPNDRRIIFYCASGGRSMAAAALAEEADVTDHEVYNLTGGIMAWNDILLPDYPKIQMFPLDNDVAKNLETGMAFEKGAMNFYLKLQEFIDVKDIMPTIRKLSDAEIGHAKILYSHWRDLTQNAQDFNTLWESMNDNVIEGGISLDMALRRLTTNADAPCINVLEFALFLEYSAYDLYRNVAEITRDSELKQAFTSLSQAEKKHIQMLAHLFKSCV